MNIIDDFNSCNHQSCIDLGVSDPTIVYTSEFGFLPLYRGKNARVKLQRHFGLPNTFPHPERIRTASINSMLSSRRLLFVDDYDDGDPVALWVPSPEEMPTGVSWRAA